MSSWILYRLIGRIFFRYLEMTCLVCIAWSYLLRQCLRFYFDLWIPTYPCMFSFFNALSCRNFFIIILFLWKFFIPALADGFFQWRLSDSKSRQVSRTHLSILADFNNAVVWIISSCPQISKASSTFTNLWGLSWAHQLQLVSLSASCYIVF